MISGSEANSTPVYYQLPSIYSPVVLLHYKCIDMNSLYIQKRLSSKPAACTSKITASNIKDCQTHLTQPQHQQ